MVPSVARMPTDSTSGLRRANSESALSRGADLPARQLFALRRDGVAEVFPAAIGKRARIFHHASAMAPNRTGAESAAITNAIRQGMLRRHTNAEGKRKGGCESVGRGPRMQAVCRASIGDSLPTFRKHPFFREQTAHATIGREPWPRSGLYAIREFLAARGVESH